MDKANLEKTRLLHEWIDQCPQGGLVFLGGAGVSTESGIPDFRSPDGLYSQKYKYPPETIISRSFFDANPQEFYEYYCEKMLVTDKKPNAAHLALARLEQQGTLSAVITQNIDGLHQAAGSRRVLELHGSVLRNNCMACGAFYDAQGIREARRLSSEGIPRCPACGGIIKPDVVLYEEALDHEVLYDSVAAIAKAQLLVVAGTSLTVYPAAGLIDYFKGEHLVIVNRSITPRDSQADLCICANVGEVLGYGS